MSNVLIYYDQKEPTNRIVCNLFEKLSRQEPLIQFREKSKIEVVEEDFLWTDVVVLIRPQSKLDYRFAKRMKKLGKTVVLHLDDDFESIEDEENSSYWNNVSKILHKIIKWCDVFWTPNRILGSKYASAGLIERLLVTDTVVDADEVKKACHYVVNNQRVKMAYYVNDSSTYLFDAVLRPALHLLAKRNPGKYEIDLFSLHPCTDDFSPDEIVVNYIERLPYDDFLFRMSNGGYAIGLAPMEDTNFTKCKYFNKYIEYTKAGIPAIYSKSSLFDAIIENGSNGILCENIAMAWADAIEQLSSSDEFRSSIIVNAQEQVLNNFSSTIQFDRIKKGIPELLIPKKRVNSLLTYKYMYSINLFLEKLSYKYTILRRINEYCSILFTLIKKREIRVLVNDISRVVKRKLQVRSSGN